MQKLYFFNLSHVKVFLKKIHIEQLLTDFTAYLMLISWLN